MGPGLAGVPSLTITWSLSTAGGVVLSSTRSAKPTGVSGFSAGPPVRGSNAYRMIRTRSVGAAGVKVPSCSYVWAVVFHTHVVPSRDGGTTLALIPVCRVLAARRSACSRREHRSEEHTSELQSPYDLVCRLLLEKKNVKRRWRSGITTVL